MRENCLVTLFGPQKRAREVSESFLVLLEKITSAAYASHLDAIIETYDINLWGHGHAHKSCGYRVENTRVVCNPRGYSPDC
jgi:hypothetical protein